MIKKEIVLIIFILLITSCKTSIDNSGNVKIRINAKSEYSKDIDFQVFIENEYGNSVNGALVLAQSESGITELFSFDNSSQSYTGSINGIEDDYYNIIVKSNSLLNFYSKKIPHTRLNKKTAVTFFSDSDGNSVLSGNLLKKNLPIQIAWNSLGQNVNYQVLVKNALNTKWTASINNCNIIIPANTLDAGNYYLYINAQKSYGDLFFETENYYSVSNISSSAITFTVQ